MTDPDPAESAPLDPSAGDLPTRAGPGPAGGPDLTGRKLGLYTLEERIGAGGQGSVWRARDGQGKARAVKVMARASFGGVDAEARLRREAEALETLRHDQVVAFHAFDLEDDLAWLAMQFVDGESAAARVRRDGALSEAEVCKVLDDVLRGLDAAHQKGIVHRDLSANNVLLERDTGRALLTDFGLAKGEPLGASLTATGAVVGTGAYIAPEVYEGRPAGPAADLWAIGVLACQLATGEVPFDAQTAAAMMRAVCDKQPDLSRLTSPRLLALCRACLVKDPARRVPSAEVALGVLRGERRFVPPPAAGERPPRRGLGAAVLCAVVLAVAAWLVFGSGWLENEPKRAEAPSAAIPPAPLGETVLDQNALDEHERALATFTARFPNADVTGQQQRLAEHRAGRTMLDAVGAALSNELIDIAALRDQLAGFDGLQSYREAAQAQVAVIDPAKLRAALRRRLPDPGRATDEGFTAEQTLAQQLEAVLPGPLQKVCAEHREAQSAARTAFLELRELRADLRAAVAAKSAPDAEALGDLRRRLLAAGLPEEEAKQWRADLDLLDRASKLIAALGEATGIPGAADWEGWQSEQRALRGVACHAAVEAALGKARERAARAVREGLQARLADRQVRAAAAIERDIELWTERSQRFEVEVGDSLEALRNEQKAAAELERLLAIDRVADRTAADQLDAEAAALPEPYRTRASRRVAELRPKLTRLDWAEPADDAEPVPIADGRVLPSRVVDKRTGITFVLIPADEFDMGSPDGVGDSDEHPRHRVRITRPFYLGETEVTVGQWRKAGITGGTGASDAHPVANVSWDDAQQFCRKFGYRLPSEAEWEYACRAGSSAAYCFGDREADLAEYAWTSNSGGKAHPVKTRRPNAWGLYDMHGNLWEWCQDWYARDAYQGRAGAVTPDPQGPETGDFRVVRGGGFYIFPDLARSANRDLDRPDYRDFTRGFRAARTP